MVPCYLGTVRLDESADTRKRSWERVDSRPYPDSEESEDDVVYAEEHENELQQSNLRNEVANQITVDTSGERCARLDDFNWVLPCSCQCFRFVFTGDGNDVAAVVKPPGGRSDET